MDNGFAVLVLAVLVSRYTKRNRYVQCTLYCFYDIYVRIQEITYLYIIMRLLGFLQT